MLCFVLCLLPECHAQLQIVDSIQRPVSRDNSDRSSQIHLLLCLAFVYKTAGILTRSILSPLTFAGQYRYISPPISQIYAYPDIRGSL